ncbi:MAG TPA: hypothetical protein VJ326_07305 [Thermoplasmata archaeon]|nr:hypothetical protein [Thermoplasmata archaeon]
MRLPAKFGACGRCVGLAVGALAISLVALFASVPAGDLVSAVVSLGLVVASGTAVVLHGIGWRRRHDSSLRD